MTYYDHGCAPLPTNAFFDGMRRTRVDRDRAHHPCGRGSGVPRCGGLGTRGSEG